MTPEQTIKRIAEVAEAVGWQAGVGACETAGMIVSILARHPGFIDEFMERGTGLMIDSDLFRHEHGCLTFLSMNGKVSTPSQLSAARQVQKLKLATGIVKPPKVGP